MRARAERSKSDVVVGVLLVVAVSAGMLLGLWWWLGPEPAEDEPVVAAPGHVCLLTAHDRERVDEIPGRLRLDCEGQVETVEGVFSEQSTSFYSPGEDGGITAVRVLDGQVSVWHTLGAPQGGECVASTDLYQPRVTSGTCSSEPMSGAR